MTTLTDFLKRTRVRYKIGQKSFSNQLGLGSAQLVSNWERGVCKVPPKHFKKISKILDIDLKKIVNAHLRDLESEVWKEVIGG